MMVCACLTHSKCTSSVSYPTHKYHLYRPQFPMLFVLLMCLVGQIDVGEIQHSLQKLGVEVTMEQASKILQRYHV